MQDKTCTICNKIKFQEDFYKYRTKCKECMKLQRELIKDKLNEYKKNYRLRNKDKIREYKKRYREKKAFDKEEEPCYCPCGSYEDCGCFLPWSNDYEESK